MIRLNDLKNFIETSQHSSLTLAARMLEITQPSLSESIKRFEKDTGQQVFYRTKNGISLTPSGRSLLIKSKKVQNAVGDLSNKISLKPHITLGCHETIASYFLPELFSEKHSKKINCNIDFKHGLSRDLQEQIQQGHIDIGVIVNCIKNPDLIIKKIATDNVCVWQSRKLVPQDKVIVNSSLFQTQSIIKKWSKIPKTMIQTTSLELIARMTANGCGYGIMPERIVKNFRFDLIKVKNTPVVKDTFSIIYRPEFGKTELEGAIVQKIVGLFNK